MKVLSLVSQWAIITLCGATFIPFIGPYTVDELDDVLLDKELVSSEALRDLIKTENLETRAKRLYECAEESRPLFGHPTRVIGSPGHFATLKYIRESLESLGGYYKVTTQGLTAVSGEVHNFSLTDTSGKVILSEPFSLTPGTKGEITAEVVEVPNNGCLGSEYKETRGKIALVKRGRCSFSEKSEFAGLNGAKAVLVYDPEQSDDELLSGTLSVPLEHHVATVAVDKDWAASAPGQTVELSVDAEIREIDTLNVIAETVEGDHDNVVMLGGHSDSVLAGPGINDDGSGTNSLLEVAKQLTNFKVNNAVRFAWWAAEEEGLIGSLYYTTNITPEEAKKIRLFLDYDMMASPNYAYFVYDGDDKVNPPGSSAIRDLYIDFYDEHGLNHTLDDFDGRSDYVGFLEIGIPAGGIDTGAEVHKSRKLQEQYGGKEGEQFDQCYHMACDNLDNLDYEAWSVNTQLIAHSVATYARSLDGFPAREDTYRISGRKFLRKYKPM